MDEDGEVAEFGSSRGTRVIVALIALALLVAGGRYLLTRGSSSPSSQRTPTALPSSTSRAPASALPTSAQVGAERPWPTRSGACGNTAYLPLVSAHPLNRTTGVRALVGDRLDDVDVDSGVARPAALPRGQYASALATARDGTYARIGPCADIVGAPVTVVRIDNSGRLQTVAHGAYGQLLSGGNHMWGVLWNESGTTTWLDPLDGTPRRRLPRDFAPLGAFGDLIVGTHSPPNMSQNAASPLQVLDPATNRVVRVLGAETTVTMSEGLVLWFGGGCTRCRLHTYDLRTGVHTTTRAELPVDVGLWAGVVSPDRRTVALLAQHSRPVPYELGHPGNPQEILTLDLGRGAIHAVPGVVLFAKSAPGLAFSPNGRWLIISLDEGTSVRLLLWRPGLTAPLESPVQLTAKVAYSPAVAALG